MYACKLFLNLKISKCSKCQNVRNVKMRTFVELIYVYIFPIIIGTRENVSHRVFHFRKRGYAIKGLRTRLDDGDSRQHIRECSRGREITGSLHSEASSRTRKIVIFTSARTRVYTRVHFASRVGGGRRVRRFTPEACRSCIWYRMCRARPFADVLADDLSPSRSAH